MEKRINLYKHNKIAYKKVKNSFDEGNDVVGIVHATGTGKSYIALKLIYDNNDKKTYYIVPNNAIIEHLKEIIKGEGLSLENDFPNLKFMTYQKLCRMDDKEIELLDIDLLVLDEFHRTGAQIWEKKIDNLVLTHPKMLIFGMTAYTVRDRKTSYERDMALVNGYELFTNRIVSKYDLVDAMIDGILPIPIYKTVYIDYEEDLKDIKKKLNNLDKNSLEYKKIFDILKSIEVIINEEKKTINNQSSIPSILKDNLKRDGKYIYFCPAKQLDDSNDIMTIMNNMEDYLNVIFPNNNYIFYKTLSLMKDSGKYERDMFYHDRDLNGNYSNQVLRMMFAINQYNEGVHAPNIDGVIMGRETKSDIVFFEQLGRALSVIDNKKIDSLTDEEIKEELDRRDISYSKNASRYLLKNLLISPVILDLTNNYEFMIELRDELKFRLKELKLTSNLNPYQTYLYDNISSMFNINVENVKIYNLIRRVDDILTSNLDKLTWDEWYEIALKYCEEKNNLFITDDYVTEDGYELGLWLKKQREAYRREELTEEQINKLNNLFILWNNYRICNSWNDYYLQCKKYYELYNDLIIPRGFRNEKGYDIGEWLYKQRDKYIKQELSEVQISKLEKIGINFALSNEEIEEEWYFRAYEYYKKNGNLNIEDNYNLEMWKKIQKNKYFNGDLTKIEKDKLDIIGMEWNKDINNLTWDEWYNLALEYYLKYNNLRILPNYEINGYSLGKWIKRQCINYNNNLLSKEKIEKLENIDIIWDSLDKELVWYDWYNLAKRYYEENDNLLVPQFYKIDESFRLGSFILYQRDLYKKKKLTERQIELLEDIGMVWNANIEKDKIKELCNKYEINIKKYRELLTRTYKEIYCKIMYLLDENMSLIIEDKLNPLFMMRHITMEIEYGISLKDLIDKYYLDVNEDKLCI